MYVSYKGLFEERPHCTFCVMFCIKNLRSAHKKIAGSCIVQSTKQDYFLVQSALAPILSTFVLNCRRNRFIFVEMVPGKSRRFGHGSTFKCLPRSASAELLTDVHDDDAHVTRTDRLPIVVTKVPTSTDDSIGLFHAVRLTGLHGAAMWCIVPEGDIGNIVAAIR